MDIETVTIPVREYNALKRKIAWLNCLENAGVDNWNGIDYAYEIFAEEYPEYQND